MPTITVTSDASGPQYQIAISDPDWNRITTKAIADRSGSILVSDAVPPVLNPDGSVQTPGVPAVYRDPTADEAFSLKCDDFFATLVSTTVQTETSVAASDAVAGVPGISATVTLPATLDTVSSSVSVGAGGIKTTPPISVGPAKVGP